MSRTVEELFTNETIDEDESKPAANPGKEENTDGRGKQTTFLISPPIGDGLPRSVTEPGTTPFTINDFKQPEIKPFFPEKNSIFDPILLAPDQVDGTKIILLGNPGFRYACAWCGYMPRDGADPFASMSKHLFGFSSRAQGIESCPVFMAKCHPFLKINQYKCSAGKGKIYYRAEMRPEFRLPLVDPDAAREAYGASIEAEIASLQKEFKRLNLDVKNSHLRVRLLTDDVVEFLSLVPEEKLKEKNIPHAHYQQIMQYKYSKGAAGVSSNENPDTCIHNSKHSIIVSQKKDFAGNDSLNVGQQSSNYQSDENPDNACIDSSMDPNIVLRKGDFEGNDLNEGGGVATTVATAVHVTVTAGSKKRQPLPPTPKSNSIMRRKKGKYIG